MVIWPNPSATPKLQEFRNLSIWPSKQLFEHPLRKIPRYTLFCKTVYSWLPTVNADIHTPYLPVNITRLLKITEFCKWVFRILPFMCGSMQNNGYFKRE